MKMEDGFFTMSDGRCGQLDYHCCKWYECTYVGPFAPFKNLTGNALECIDADGRRRYAFEPDYHRRTHAVLAEGKHLRFKKKKL